MSNPQILLLPADEWSKVASAVTVGRIHIISSIPIEYYSFFKVEDDPPPFGLEGAEILQRIDDISSSFKIDVYIYPLGSIGKVRVDI